MRYILCDTWQFGTELKANLFRDNCRRRGLDAFLFRPLGAAYLWSVWVPAAARCHSRLF